MENRKTTNPQAFSLVELLIVIAIIGILSSVSYFAIQGVGDKAKNGRVTDDLLAISAALEEYRADHNNKYPVPAPSLTSNQNILCFYMDSTYAHDCANADFVQGMIDSTLLSKRYLRSVPADPRTGSRYVYGVTAKGDYYQLAGIYEENGGYKARTVGNLARGFELPSLIRSYDSQEFVTDKGKYLPYNPNPNELTGKLRNIKGTVSVGTVSPAKDDDTVKTGDTIKTTTATSSADIYFSDGSVTHLDANSTLYLKELTAAKNDSSETSTSVKIKITAGKIWNKVARLSSKSSFDVETSSAIAGVRGTEFGVDFSADKITVLSGSVDVYPINGTPNSAPTFSNVTPDKPKEAVIGSGTIAPASIADATLSNIIDFYYKNIPLTSNMVPRILTVKYDSVKKGVITVRDVNYYADIVNKALTASAQLQIPIARMISATDLAVYTNSTGSGMPAQTVALSGKTPPYTIENLSIDTQYYLRFEDSVSKKTSAFTIPVTIKLTTKDLTEKDIYTTLAGSSTGSLTEFPEIVLKAPYFASYKVGVDNIKFPYTFSVSAEVKGYTIPTGTNITYNVSSSGTATNCKPASATGTVTSNTFEIPFKVTGSPDGTCEVTVSATINGKTVTGKTTVDVVKPSHPRIILKSPKEDTAVETGKKITFEWDTRGMPDEYAGYDITVKNGNQTVKTHTVTTHPQPLPENSWSYDYTPTNTGNYTWEIIMKDKRVTTAPEPLEGRTGKFIVGNTPAVNTFTSIADFEIKQGNTVILKKGQTPAQTQAAIPSLNNNSLPFTVTAWNPQSGYSYEWKLNGFDTPGTALTSSTNTFTTAISSLQPKKAKYASVTLTVRDDAKGTVAGTVTKGVTVMGYDLITGIAFSPTSSTFISAQTSLTLPSVTVTPSSAGPIDFSKYTCISAKSGTVAGSTYTPPSVKPSADTLTCTLTAGEVINGYAVAPNVSASLTINFQGQAPALAVAPNPPSIDVNSAGTVTITATGGTGTVTCAKTGGGGTLTGTVYSPVYTNTEAVTGFKSGNRDTVIITCTDSAAIPQTATATITINYKPFQKSSNYMYSHAGGSGVAWSGSNGAKQTCDDLQEGGNSDWALPLSTKLVSEKSVWCGGTSSCPNMPNGAKTHWAEEVSSGSLDAYAVLFTPNTPILAISKSTSQNTYGYRCVRNLNP